MCCLQIIHMLSASISNAVCKHFKHCLQTYLSPLSGYGRKMAAAGGGCHDQQFEESDIPLSVCLQDNYPQALGAGVARAGGAVCRLLLLDHRSYRSNEE